MRAARVSGRFPDTLVRLTRGFAPLVAVFALLALPCGRVPAADTDTDLTVPLDGMTFCHPCSGETVTLQGSMRIRADITVNGDDVTTTLHVDTHGVSATTSVLLPGEKPRKYVSNETDNETMHFRLSAGPTTQQTETTWTFIRSGEDGGVLCCGDDFLTHLTLHVTFVNGRVTASPSTIKCDCK